MSSTGTASGGLIGKGSATFDLIVTENVLNGCQEYNDSMFVIAPKDLEELELQRNSMR